MDDRFKGFLRTCLGLEMGYDMTGYLRPTLTAFSDSYVESVREGFAEIIADDSFGPDEYERLTDVEFPDRETLHAHLQDMYDYLFNAAPRQPMPPG